MKNETIAVIPMDFPVQLANRELTELTMRSPTVDDELKYAPTSRNIRKQMEEEAIYFSRLCGITLEEMKFVHARDYKKVAKQYLLFRDGETEQKRTDAGGVFIEPFGEDESL